MYFILSFTFAQNFIVRKNHTCQCYQIRLFVAKLATFISLWHRFFGARYFEILLLLKTFLFESFKWEIELIKLHIFSSVSQNDKRHLKFEKEKKSWKPPKSFLTSCRQCAGSTRKLFEIHNNQSNFAWRH